MRASPSPSRRSSASSRNARAAIAGRRPKSATSSKQRIGGGIRSVVPGSDAAARLKEALIDDGLWSQYLEVAIGPDAESSPRPRRCRASAGARRSACAPIRAGTTPSPKSCWSSNSRGEIVGATLGNDVNLRDFEGRSALLLSKAKDNNASCAIGPFIRLFDDASRIDDVRPASRRAWIDGRDGFRLRARADERDQPRSRGARPQALSEHHYPDGFVLFLGTLFAPTEDRDEPGRGFTHKLGDEVRILDAETRHAGQHVSTTSRDAPRVGTSGSRALMRNLASRGLLPKGWKDPMIATPHSSHQWRKRSAATPHRRKPQPVEHSTMSSRAIPKGGAAEVDAGGEGRAAPPSRPGRSLARSPLDVLDKAGER